MDQQSQPGQSPESAAIMKFATPPGAKFTISHTLPEELKTPEHEVKEAAVEVTIGEFGYYVTQEITDRIAGSAELNWVAGWLDFVITKQTFLYPVTKLPLIALYAGLENTIPCILQGIEPIPLVLEEGKLGVYFVPPDIKNEATFAPKHYKAVYFSFSNAYLDKFKAEHPQFQAVYDKKRDSEMQGQRIEPIDLNANDYHIIELLRTSTLQGEALKKLYEAYTSLLLIGYYLRLSEREKLPVTKTRQYHEAISIAVQYIDTAYSNPKSVPEIARLVFVNETTFRIWFKDIMKRSPAEYILDQKFLHVEEALKDPKLSVNQIAHMTGFADGEHLSKMFKKRYHITPAKYRMNLPGYPKTA